MPDSLVGKGISVKVLRDSLYPFREGSIPKVRNPVKGWDFTKNCVANSAM
jgi:hypothetical protein